MEKFVLTAVLIILAFLIGFGTGKTILDMKLSVALLAIADFFIAVYAYKKCRTNVLKNPRPIQGFFKKYWYDMKCNYLTIFVALSILITGMYVIDFLKL